MKYEKRDKNSQNLPYKFRGIAAERKQRYEQEAQRLIPVCVENNQNLKEQVGQCIYNSVKELVGLDEDQAQKITGMIIDLPIPKQKLVLMSYESLQTAIKKAQELLQVENNPHQSLIMQQNQEEQKEQE